MFQLGVDQLHSLVIRPGTVTSPCNDVNTKRD